MTQKQMIDTIRAMAMTCRVRDGEIRVNYRGGDEDTAYYTDDRQDAIDTARDMARSRTVSRDFTDYSEEWEQFGSW